MTGGKHEVPRPPLRDVPTPDSPFPTVQLRHDELGGEWHIDWMLAVDPRGEQPLVTFRLPAPLTELAPGGDMVALRIDDHRPRYLVYEGPLSGQRGSVKRIARGGVTRWTREDDAWCIDVRWHESRSIDESFRLHIRSSDMMRWAVQRLDRAAPHEDQEADMDHDRNDQSRSDGPSKIRHQEPSYTRGSPGDSGADMDPMLNEDAPVPMAEAEGPVGLPKKITAFERQQMHEDSWKRVPNTTGQGAIHVRTFHAKLTDEALRYLDQTVNEWLDAHPQYEVKFVTSTVGVLTGKLKEPHLICQVWV